MNDRKIIYLDDAIDAAKDWYEGLICGSFRGLEKRLKSLPSAQPQRKMGKWIEIAPEEGHEIYTVKCDQCGRYDFFETNYCGNCGADMREAERLEDG